MTNHLTHFWPYYLATFILTIIFVNAFKKPAQYIVLVDFPGGRKIHSGAIPLIGGASIVFSFICISLFLDFPLREYGSLFLGAGILLVTGLVDDLVEIKARTRLFIQIIVATMMTTWGGMNIEILGNLFGYGNIYLDYMSIPLTIFLVVGYINSINMIDGADGLAGGLLFIMGLSLFLLSISSGYTENIIVLLGMYVSSILAFLLYNYRHPWRKRADIFMGDSGSMSLGYILIWLAIYFSQDPVFEAQPISITWILVLPLFDSSAIIIRRILTGRNPFAADRYHIHHILSRHGLSQHTTVNIILFTSIIFSLTAYVGWKINVAEYYMNYILFALFFLYIYFTIYMYKHTQPKNI